MSVQSRNILVSVALGAGLLAMSAPMATAQEPAASEGGYAIVAADGTLVHGLNVADVSHVSGSGVYVVTFKHSAKKCAAEATIQGDPGLILPGYIVVSKSGAKAVQVNTYATLTILPADFHFSLTLTCGA